MFYLILVICWQIGLASDSNGQNNAGAVVNSPLKISCIIASTEEVLWHYYLPNEDKIKINDDGDIILPLFDNFRVGEKAHMLETDSVQLKNAGSLSCSSSGKELSIDLIVLTSHPNCDFKTTPNETELHCSVGYAGKLKPSIEWTKSGGSTTTGTLHFSENNASSTLIIPSVGSTVFPHHVCRVFFSDKSVQPSVTSTKPQSFSCSLGDSDSPSKIPSDAKHWIIIGFVTAACVVVLVIIVVVVRNQRRACKTSPGPDLVQLADIALHQNGQVFMNRNDHCAPAAAAAAAARPLPAFPDEEGQVRDIVYAEVTVDERRTLHYMHDSPAWNNAHIDGVKSLQSSPAWSHNNGKVYLSKTNPRKEKPMDIDGIEYLDVSSVARIPVPPNQLPRRPPARLPSKSYLPNTYAAIDHTSRPPPPPPPEDE